MTEEPQTLNGVIIGHLENTALATRVVKGAMLLGGALIAGVAQFMEIDKQTGIASHQVAGITGTVAVFLAALWTLLKEQDATNELTVAMAAKNEADERSQQVDELFAVFGDMDKASHLLVGSNILRGYIEHICTARECSEEEILGSVFSMAGRSISLAMGLSGNDEWTICAYKAHPDTSGKDKLRLIEHARAIGCDKAAAREWEEGVGVAGICYSTEREIVVPDFQGDGVGSLFNVGRLQRHYDASRYQSIVAVPIQVETGARPWGVITATSDRKYHFEPDARGIQNTEGVRTLAGFIALALAIRTKLAKAEPAS